MEVENFPCPFGVTKSTCYSEQANGYAAIRINALPIILRNIRQQKGTCCGDVIGKNEGE